MTAKKERVYLFDNLKFILMVLVVFGHCIEIYTPYSNLLMSSFAFVYFFHMPAFIFISGLFADKVIEDRQKTIRYIEYLLILFLLLKILITIIKLVVYKKFIFDLLTTGSIPWFLLVLAYYFAITYLVKNIDCRLILGGSILLACLAGYSDRIGDFLCLSRAIVYFPFFYAGYICDTNKLIAFAKEKRKPVMAAGLVVIAFTTYLCFFHLDQVAGVRCLFSGKNPFSQLAYPKMGGLLRFIYYPAVISFIFSLIILTPDIKLPFTEAGRRTLQVYFWHFTVVHPLRGSGIFDYITTTLPGIWRWLTFFVIALGITIFFSLPPWGVPFRLLRKALFGESQTTSDNSALRE